MKLPAFSFRREPLWILGLSLLPVAIGLLVYIALLLLR